MVRLLRDERGRSFLLTAVVCGCFLPFSDINVVQSDFAPSAVAICKTVPQRCTSSRRRDGPEDGVNFSR